MLMRIHDRRRVAHEIAKSLVLCSKLRRNIGTSYPAETDSLQESPERRESTVRFDQARHLFRRKYGLIERQTGMPAEFHELACPFPGRHG
jgi:hypothetical protein